MWFRSAALLALALAGCGFAGDEESARPRVRFGALTVNAGYSYYSGPRYYPYYGYGPWAGYGWAYIYPGFFTGYGYAPNLGEIKLKTDDPATWVYLDGALAGKADKLKSMWLEPGKYELEVRSGNKRFGQKVYVLSGKTLRLTADPAKLEVRP
jgi:hypothetical protein